MREINIWQIFTFLFLFMVSSIAGILSTIFLSRTVNLGDFKGVVLFFMGVILIYVYSFISYRVFLFLVPLKEGEIKEHSKEEFSTQVYFLFYIILFNSLVRTHFLPIPLLRLVFLALGAKMGKNTYSAGAILDPPLTRVGDNTIIGHDAVLFSHAIEGSHLSLKFIDIGNNVTIGSKAVIMSGVTIGDGAIVCAGAVVLKDSKIGQGEIWGGIPAKKIRKKIDE